MPIKIKFERKTADVYVTMYQGIRWSIILAPCDVLNDDSATFWYVMKDIDQVKRCDSLNEAKSYVRSEIDQQL